MVLVIGVGRVVTILPNKMIGVIGEHAEYPIERLGMLFSIYMCSFILFDSTGFMLYWLIACLLWQCMLSVKPTPAHKCVDRSSVVSAAFSHDRTTLGSASHDNTVKLWDVKYLQEGDDEASEGVDTKQQASLGENTGSQGHGQTDSTIISGDDSDDEMEAEGMSMSRIFAAFSAKTASGGLVLVHLLCKTGT
jgi:WD40 repeat protein